MDRQTDRQRKGDACAGKSTKVQTFTPFQRERERMRDRQTNRQTNRKKEVSGDYA